MTTGSTDRADERYERLLLREFEAATQAAGAARSIQDRAMGWYGAILAALITFIVKKDLPDTAYLLVASVIFVGGTHLTQLSFRKVCANDVARISELRLRDWVAGQLSGRTLFDLGDRSKFLRDWAPRSRVLRRAYRHLVQLLVAGFYGSCVVLGATALKAGSAVSAVVSVSAIAAGFLLALVGWLQNNTRRERYRVLMASPDHRIPDV